MNKMILTEKDILFLLDWRDKHKDLVRMFVDPVRAIKIDCIDSKCSITGIRSGNNVTLTVNQNGKSLGKMVFSAVSGGFCKMVKDKTKLSEENKQAVLTVYCSAIAFMVFGNETTEPTQQKQTIFESSAREAAKRKKNKSKNGFVYIIDHGGKMPKIKLRGSHASPNGQFSVRGHFRHYKSGKVVWIDEFQKGTGKTKSKTYKIGN